MRILQVPQLTSTLVPINTIRHTGLARSFKRNRLIAPTATMTSKWQQGRIYHGTAHGGEKPDVFLSTPPKTVTDGTFSFVATNKKRRGRTQHSGTNRIKKRQWLRENKRLLPNEMTFILPKREYPTKQRKCRRTPDPYETVSDYISSSWTAICFVVQSGTRRRPGKKKVSAI